MPLIEGVGDEVTLTFGVVLIVLVIVFAWLSTHTRDIPFFSVLVVELRQRRRLRNQSSEQTNENTDEAAVLDSEPAEGDSGNTNASQSDHAQSESNVASDVADIGQREATPTGNSDSNIDSENTDSSVIEPEDETDLQETQDSHSYPDPRTDSPVTQVVETVTETQTDIQSVPVLFDSHLDGKTLRQRRLEFFSRQANSDTHSGSPTANNQTASNEARDTDQSESSVSPPCGLGERDVAEATQSNVNDSGSSSQTSQTDASQAFISSPQPGQSGSAEREIELEAGNIRVKLKYLNDTQRLVQASPRETIGNFKRAHFASEMADNKLVRLIFNGQDLRNDTSTLQAYNIQDNCTVHCLITPLEQQPAADQSDSRNADMDISMLMFPLFGLVLAAVWYFRFAYRQYFNTMSTFSLLGITFLFCIAFFSTWRAQRDNHQHID